MSPSLVDASSELERDLRRPTSLWLKEMRQMHGLNQAQLQRVGFLTNLMHHPAARQGLLEAFSVPTFSRICSETAANLQPLLEYRPTDTSRLKPLRETLLRVEAVLRNMRHDKGAEVDSQLEYGQYVLDARRKIGLCLGAGGFTGSAHLGTAMAMQELGIPVHKMAGVSMGAAVGGMVLPGIDRQTHQFTNQGIDLARQALLSVRTPNDMFEDHEGKRRLDPFKFPALTNQVMQSSGQPSIPFWAQARRRVGKKSERVFLQAENLWNVFGYNGMVAASCAARPYGFSTPATYKNEEYTHDWTAPFTSTSPGNKKLREEGADIVISSGAATVDNLALRTLRQKCFGHDLGDVCIRVKKGLAVKLAMLQSKVVLPKYWLSQLPGLGWVDRLPPGIPHEAFIAAGHRNARKELKKNLGLFGLDPLDEEFLKNA